MTDIKKNVSTDLFNWTNVWFNHVTELIHELSSLTLSPLALLKKVFF